MWADSVIVSIGNAVSRTYLPKDTALCSGHSLVLDAGAGFSNYLWQDGGNAQSISVSNPGTYWVRVEGSGRCIGTETSDTIRVTTKDCSYGIYFPNAFTPNKDGRNDLFRPVVIGYPVFYHFSIYNRWGQSIFDTTDPHKGWDGRIGGHDQGTGTYVWICTYQFAGDKKFSRKGNFTLLH